MKQIISIIAMAATLLIGCGVALAGQIDPSLAGMLKSLRSDEQVNLILVMEEQVDTHMLVNDLTLADATLAERHEEVLWRLQDAAEATQPPVLEILRSMGLRGDIERVRPLWIANMIAVTCRADAVSGLADLPGVALVTWDAPIQLVEPVSEEPAASGVDGVEPGLEAIGAPAMWAQGFTGSGVIVCDIDTGADGTHEAFASRWRGLLPGVPSTAAWFDPVTNTTFPFDSGSHGTHTLGTICGKNGNDIIGVAYDAIWIAAGVIDRASIERTYSDALLAFQWAADPDGNPSTMNDVPAVINNSWGLIPVTHGKPACDNTLWAAIDNVEAAGATVVFAAGNEGSAGSTIRVPADRITSSVNVFSVGALQQGGTNIASFSSRGPSKCDNSTVKPEVCAVGENVRSSVPGGYSTMSGTSMATPHVAGAIAILKQVNPEATPEQIKLALYMTAVDLGSTGEDNTYGRGRIDIPAAAAYLGVSQNYGKIVGTVTDEDSDPITWARINVDGTPIYSSTNSEGEYVLWVMGNQTVSLTCTAFGYEDGHVGGIQIVPQEVETVNFELVALPPGTLAGTVKDTDGNPIADATIAALGTPLQSVSTNSQGAYTYIVPGGINYSIQASADGYNSKTQQIQVDAGKITVLNFELSKDTCLFKAAAQGTNRFSLYDMFRDVRGLLAEGDRGASFVGMYYRDSGELVMIFRSHPSLWHPTLEAIDRLDLIARRLNSQDAAFDNMPLLNADDVDFFLDLADQYMEFASPELTGDLNLVASELATLEGRTPAEVLAWINGASLDSQFQQELEIDPWIEMQMK